MASNSKNIAELLNGDVTVTATDIADGSVTTAKIADGAVTQVKTTGVGKGKNLLINGAMNVWQRATSNGTVSANTYPAADRWKFWVGGAATSTTRTEFTTGQTDVPNIRYYNSIVVGANSAAGDYSTFNQHIEDVTLFDNVTVTLSFYAKASTAWTVGIEPIQNFGTGGTPSSRVLGTPQTVSVGTSWERHTVTFTLPSISGKTLGTTANTSNFELAFWLTGGSDFDARTGSIGNQSGTFDVTGIQLEYGSTATPFEKRSYAEELQLCSRYFQNLGNLSIPAYNSNVADTGGTRFGTVALSVPMRDSPTYSYDDNAGNSQRVYAEYPNSTSATNVSVSVFGGNRFIEGLKYPYGNLYGSNGDSYRLIFYNMELSAEL